MSKKIKVKIKNLTFAPNFSKNNDANDESTDENLIKVEFPFGNFLLEPKIWELMKETRDERDELKERLDNLLGKMN
jgi:hypothetical protein